MGSNKKARQPREGAVTGPDAEPCVPAGSPILDSTTESPQDRNSPPAADTIGATVPLSAAEVLLGAAMWLANERDSLDDDLSLARSRLGLVEGEAADSAVTVALPLADLERLQHGLSRAVALLDRLAIDPTKITAVRAADPAAAPARVLQ